MQKKAKRPYHHGDLKRVLLETAMDMLGEEKGWQFTLREVARRAKVSHAAPYKHFPDKAALLAAMALNGFDQLRTALLAVKTNRPRPLRDRLLAIAHAYIHFSTSNPELYRLMFSAEVSDLSDVHSSERALATLGVVIDLVELGQADGLLRKRDVRGQAAACWALVHGISLLMIDGLFREEKVGHNGVQNALGVLLEGLEK